MRNIEKLLRDTAGLEVEAKREAAKASAKRAPWKEGGGACIRGRPSRRRWRRAFNGFGNIHVRTVARADLEDQKIQCQIVVVEAAGSNFCCVQSK